MLFLRKTAAFCCVILFVSALPGLGVNADYKQVLISTGTDFVRIRLPLTDVTGKVRVKEKSADGFGLPIAPSKTTLGQPHYLEWQIGYDTPNTNSLTVVPQICFQRNGETKYGHELAKIIFEAVRIGVLSTNDLMQEMAALKQIPATEFEENQPVQIEPNTNGLADEFQRAVQRVPQFTKETPHGFVQIQLKQK
jgi:hypothetical protein